MFVITQTNDYSNIPLCLEVPTQSSRLVQFHHGPVFRKIIAPVSVATDNSEGSIPVIIGERVYSMVRQAEDIGNVLNGDHRPNFQPSIAQQTRLDNGNVPNDVVQRNNSQVALESISNVPSSVQASEQPIVDQLDGSNSIVKTTVGQAI